MMRTWTIFYSVDFIESLDEPRGEWLLDGWILGNWCKDEEGWGWAGIKKRTAWMPCGYDQWRSVAFQLDSGGNRKVKAGKTN